MENRRGDKTLLNLFERLDHEDWDTCANCGKPISDEMKKKYGGMCPDCSHVKEGEQDLGTTKPAGSEEKCKKCSKPINTDIKKDTEGDINWCQCDESGLDAVGRGAGPSGMNEIDELDDLGVKDMVKKYPKNWDKVEGVADDKTAVSKVQELQKGSKNLKSVENVDGEVNIFGNIPGATEIVVLGVYLPKEKELYINYGTKGKPNEQTGGGAPIVGTAGGPAPVGSPSSMPEGDAHRMPEQQVAQSGLMGTQDTVIARGISDKTVATAAALRKKGKVIQDVKDPKKWMVVAVEAVDEKTPPGWEPTVLAMKKHKDIKNPWALAWWMKGKGYKSRECVEAVDKLLTETAHGELYADENCRDAFEKELDAAFGKGNWRLDGGQWSDVWDLSSVPEVMEIPVMNNDDMQIGVAKVKNKFEIQSNGAQRWVEPEPETVEIEKFAQPKAVECTEGAFKDIDVSIQDMVKQGVSDAEIVKKVKDQHPIPDTAIAHAIQRAKSDAEFEECVKESINEKKKGRFEVSSELVEKLAKKLGVDFEKVDRAEFERGLDIEQEHGSEAGDFDVTGDDPETTAKITMAHISEIPDYNTRLSKMESDAKSEKPAEEEPAPEEAPAEEAPAPKEETPAEEPKSVDEIPVESVKSKKKKDEGNGSAKEERGEGDQPKEKAIPECFALAKYLKGRKDITEKQKLFLKEVSRLMEDYSRKDEKILAGLEGKPNWGTNCDCDSESKELEDFVWKGPLGKEIHTYCLNCGGYGEESTI